MSCNYKTGRPLFRWTLFLSFFTALAGLPAAEPAGDLFKPDERNHWAFQKLRKDPPPALASKWIQNPIDAFILAELQKKGLKPSPAADRVTLLRRAKLDLLGLPPTPEEVSQFLADQSSDAFGQAVDRFLASPQYGERWARHWLDLARYAESEGFKEDETRPNIWRYRDYVIQSFNEDKPYDKFVQEQIAGDELWPEDFSAKVATGFNRHFPDEHNARVLQQRRQEILNDITDTVGAVFCGMTYACARCHNHKFDPILQTDYYRLQAFFANVRANDNMPLLSKEDLQSYQAKLTTWEEKTAEIRAQMAKLEAPKRQEIIDDLVYKYPEEIQEAIRKPAQERTPFEWLMYHKARQYLDPESYMYVAPTTAVLAKLKGEQRKRWDELKVELDKFKDLHPGKLPLAAGMVDAGRTAPGTFLLNRGAYDKPKEEVQPGLLTILNMPTPAIAQPAGEESTGRRTALAKMLTDPQNPLTARVMVNRLWHYHFGRGLVGTPSDFGAKGERPSHPELLDWLAGQFMSQGWSMKKMHRMILTSATYQQASKFSEAGGKVDPDNRLLWHFSRQRLEGEVIRDEALLVAGVLNPKMGGPSILPELPPGMAARGGWKTTPDEGERNRRSIYVFVKRNTRYPMFETFDMPDTHESCARRNVTTSPVQALTMLNSELTYKWARAFAARVMREAGNDQEAQVAAAYRIALSRAPDAEEKKLVRAFFQKQEKIVSEVRDGEIERGLLAPALSSVGRKRGGSSPASGEETDDTAEVGQAPAGPESGAQVALVDFCHMLLNSNEFVYQN